MAERHGAQCSTVFDARSITVLLYRPGYERSDKVRLCVERFSNIPVVPINWLLDSLLQSRQIHPSLYRLNSVPTVALPAAKGPVLPHHQHPYYVMNAEEYSLVPLQLPRAPETLIVTKTSDPTQLPTFREPEPRVWHSIDIWDAAARCCANQEHDHEDEDRETNRAFGLELFSSLCATCRLPQRLLAEHCFLLSESFPDSVQTVISACGGRVSTNIEECTHFLYHANDKKKDLIVAAFLCSKTNISFQICSSTWLEDCLLLGELLPLGCPYVPSSKLFGALQKRIDKKNEKP